MVGTKSSENLNRVYTCRLNQLGNIDPNLISSFIAAYVDKFKLSQAKSTGFLDIIILNKHFTSHINSNIINLKKDCVGDQEYFLHDKIFHRLINEAESQWLLDSAIAAGFRAVKGDRGILIRLSYDQVKNIYKNRIALIEYIYRLSMNSDDYAKILSYNCIFDRDLYEAVLEKNKSKKSFLHRIKSFFRFFKNQK